MSKKPKLEHDYHHKKDRLEITIHGYALKSKKSRDSLMKKIMVELERSPARLIAKEKVTKKKGKKCPGSRRDVRDLQEVGD